MVSSPSYRSRVERRDVVTMRARQYVLFRNIRHSSRVTTNRAPVNLSSPLRSSSRIQPNEYHGPFLSFLLLLLLLLFLLNPSFGGGEGRDSKIAERRGLETRDDTIHGGRGNYLFRNGGGKYELTGKEDGKVGKSRPRGQRAGLSDLLSRDRAG